MGSIRRRAGALYFVLTERAYARLCVGMHGYAQLCADMRGYAGLCAVMRGYARLCAGMCGRRALLGLVVSRLGLGRD